MESFFSHMKDEGDFTDCQTIDEVRARAADYISYYSSKGGEP
ncbi:IS3 family transposase [Paenibacillus albidus]|nr:IS3 family transposase [Paenibacillus albidus]